MFSLAAITLKISPVLLDIIGLCFRSEMALLVRGSPLGLPTAEWVMIFPPPWQFTRKGCLATVRVWRVFWEKERFFSFFFKGWIVFWDSIGYSESHTISSVRGKSSRTGDCPLSCPESWTWAFECSSPFPLFLEWVLVYLPSSLLPEASQGHNLGLIMWWRDYLDCGRDWTQVNLPNRFVSSWGSLRNNVILKIIFWSQTIPCFWLHITLDKLYPNYHTQSHTVCNWFHF